MRDPRFRFLPLVAALILVACESDEDTSPTTYPPATCQQVCEKSVPLACVGDSYTDVPTCVAQCEAQIAGCANQAIIDNYLGCAVATPMSCGDTLGTSSSPECVGEGLAYFACLNGMDLTDVGGSDAGTDSGGSDTTGSTDPVSPPAVPSASNGEIAFSLATAGGTEGPMTCVVGSGASSLGVTELPEAAGGGFGLSASCTITTETTTYTAYFSLVRPSLAPGTYPITSSTPEATSTDSAGAMSIVDGAGYSMTGNGNGGVVWEGEVVVEAFDATARTASGYATFQWPKAAEVVDGVARNVVDYPGAASIRFASP